MKMKKNLKKKDRGFSLVELIVVIAIIGILTVTLAPRLTGYIEKARKASDNEVINTIYTAVRLAVLDEDTLTDAIALAETGFDLNETTDSLYTVSTNGWEINSSCTLLDTAENLLALEIESVVGNFKLKSKGAGVDTQITITVVNADDIQVELKYDGTNVDYTASDDSIRP
jgi:prepilin-type N-terminal cleavage/methylation domain-containing protein